MNIRSLVITGLLILNSLSVSAKNSLKLSFGPRQHFEHFENNCCPRELTPCETFVLGCGMCVAGGLMLYDAIKSETPRVTKQEELIKILEHDLIDLKDVLKNKKPLYYTSLNNYEYAYSLSNISHLQGTAVQKLLNENSYLSKKVKNVLESTKHIVHSLQLGYCNNSESIAYHKKRIARNLKKSVAILEKKLEMNYPISFVQKTTKKLRDLIAYFNESQSYWY